MPGGRCRGGRLNGRAGDEWDLCVGRLGTTGNDVLPDGAATRKCSMVVDRVKAGWPHQGAEPGDEIQGRQDNGPGAVLPRRTEAIPNLAVILQFEALRAERRSGHVPAQAFEPAPVGDQSRILAKNGEDMFGIIRDTYDNKQAVDDELARKRSSATLGLVDLDDDRTGTTHSVSDDSTYYWIDSKGTIVGTRTADPPSPDFRALDRRP